MNGILQVTRAWLELSFLVDLIFDVALCVGAILWGGVLLLLHLRGRASGLLEYAFGEVGQVAVEEMLKVFDDELDALREDGDVRAWQRKRRMRGMRIAREFAMVARDGIAAVGRRVIGTMSW